MTWTFEEVARFLAVAQTSRHYILYLAAITTGMRKGELLALRWQDVDLDEGIATIQQTLIKPGANPVFGKPKSDHSRRQVALLPELVKARKLHKIEHNQAKLRAGAACADFGLVFTSPSGIPVHPAHVIDSNFEPLMMTAGVPRIRFHDLRHTHATLLRSRGIIAKVVSERLCHSGVGITLDVYAHVMPDMQKQAVEVLETQLFSARASKPGV